MNKEGIELKIERKKFNRLFKSRRLFKKEDKENLFEKSRDFQKL